MRISDWSSDVCSSDLARKRLLVVDDSVTTRTLEKSILEAAGYEVLEAADGAEAWQLLGERGADLVVRSEEHTSELQSLMRISYAVFCLKKKNKKPMLDKA